MILFFGTRPGKTEISQLSGLTCPYCSQRNTLTASMTSNWFHLFWLKLFKISAHTVIDCSHCKRAYFKEEFSPEMVQALDEAKK